MNGKIKYLCLFLGLLSITAFGQNNSYKFETAKNFEKDGQYDKALSIYEELYKSDSTNFDLISRLKSLYKITNNHSSRINVISRQLSGDSLNVALIAELADAYYRNKNIEYARVLVNKAVQLSGKSVSSYRMIAAMMIENRWFDEVERVYQYARKSMGQEDLFVIEMAKLHMYRGDYYSATKELFKYYRMNVGTFSYLQTQLNQFPDTEKDNASVIKAIKEELIDQPKDRSIQKLLIESYLKNKNYDLAFEQCKQLDRLTGNDGIEVLNFANLTFQSEAYDVAQKAFIYFLALYPNSPQAEIGLARCFEKMDNSIRHAYDIADTVSKVKESAFSNEAVKMYRTVVKKYPSTEWSAEAYFRIGEIYIDRFQDVDEALNQFKAVLSDYSATPLRYDAIFRIAECLIVRGKLNDAMDQYSVVRMEVKGGEVKDRADFMIGVTLFYKQDFDSCRNLMKLLARRQDGVFVNDALTYLLLIQDGNKAKEELKDYSRAVLFEKQRKYSESMTILRSLIENNPKSPLADDAMLKTGELFVKTGDYDKAIVVFNNVADYMTTSPLTDLALMKAGEVYEYNLKDLFQAVKTYKGVLTRFPRSIYSVQARKKVRELEQKIQKSS
ncbi:tetratricopeptide repeat protein [bacterium]|nr:tetratricopeptide repeat protein [bacterium]